MTNSFEGNIFVNQAMFSGTNTTLTDYVTQLFSQLDESQIEQVADVYSTDPDLPDTLSQAEAIMGESKLVSVLKIER